jgi:ribose/xylose/arabinose/galactoside ABC-type transport system permease subunit
MSVSPPAAFPSQSVVRAPESRIRALLASPVASIAITLIAVVAGGLGLIGPRFLSASNIAIIGSFVAVPMLIAAFSGFALLAGVVDLSIGSMVGFSSAVFAALVFAGWGDASAFAVTLFVCAACGALNATAIVGFGADPIAATLGMLTALRGLTYVIIDLTGTSGAISAFDPALFAFTDFKVHSVPLIFLLALVVVAIAAIIVTRTRIGRHIQAVGGDFRAAARAGIAVSAIRAGALIASAVGAGIGGIFYVGMLGSAAKLTGTGLEFQVYAAMMIGGYSILRGGVGNPLGGALGLLAVAGVANILDLSAISPYYVNIVVGLLLLAAVLLDRIRGGDSYE